MSKSTKSAPSSNPEIHFSPDCDPAEFSLRVFALRRQAWDILDAMEVMIRTLRCQVTQYNRDFVDHYGKAALKAANTAEELKDWLFELENFAPAADVLAAMTSRKK